MAREYLTGFRKRKDERRRIAQEQILNDFKEEKRKIKQKKREELNEKWEKLNIKLDFDHIVQPKVYELEDHTVTVTDVSGVDFAANAGLHIGTNQVDSEAEESEPEKKRVKPKGSDSETEEDSAKSDQDDASTENSKKSKKHKGKFHKNMTHLMSKTKMAKVRKKQKLIAKTPSNLREKGTFRKKKSRNPRN